MAAIDRWVPWKPFHEMRASDTGMYEDKLMSQTSGVNPSLYTNYKKPKPAKKPAKKGC